MNVHLCLRFFQFNLFVVRFNPKTSIPIYMKMYNYGNVRAMYLNPSNPDTQSSVLLTFDSLPSVFVTMSWFSPQEEVLEPVKYDSFFCKIASDVVLITFSWRQYSLYIAHKLMNNVILICVNIISKRIYLKLYLNGPFKNRMYATISGMSL